MSRSKTFKSEIAISCPRGGALQIAASVGEDTRCCHGLMPFVGLTTKQRYAEVLGYELAHAVDVFQNAESLRVYQQLEREARDLEVGDINDANGDGLKQLESVEQLMRQIEKPAEAVTRTCRSRSGARPISVFSCATSKGSLLPITIGANSGAEHFGASVITPPQLKMAPTVGIV